MPVDECEDLWNSITVIEAQQTLVNITVSQWAHMTKNDRSKTHKRLHKQAYPDSFSTKKEITTEQLQMFLGQGGSNG